jgi:hypothetical protein
MFGEAEFGECAKRLEDNLIACSADQHAAGVRGAAETLGRAA